MQIIIEVLAFPPSDSFNSLVSLESLYDTKFDKQSLLQFLLLSLVVLLVLFLLFELMLCNVDD